jgi:hypothetical protein
MIVRQDCARVISNPGAHKLLNLGERARMRQDRQGLATYCTREKKYRMYYVFFSIDNNRSKNPGDPGASSIYAALLRSNPGATLAQPWRRALSATDAKATWDAEMGQPHAHRQIEETS